MAESLTSLISSNQYSREITNTPFVCGVIMGNTYNTGFTFGSAGPTIDPGGLFGWLTYGRVYRLGNNEAAKGTTSDTYIVYTNPDDLVFDANRLSGISGALITNPNSGQTYSFFENGGIDGTGTVTIVNSKATGKDFLFALHCLAYGGSLVIAANSTGLDNYINDEQVYFDVVTAQEAGSTLAQWLINQPYTVGIFPTIAANGLTGAGYTLANYTTLFGSASYVTGNTVANRIFNVCGIKNVSNIDTTTLYPASKISYKIPATADVVGFFTRAKSRGQFYLTVAGLNIATVLNGQIQNPINWNDTLKTTLRTNRANFFVNYTTQYGANHFLGSDLTGATLNSQILPDNRIGPANLKVALTKVLTDIGLRYLYQINNAQTRAQVTSIVETSLDPFAPFIDTTKTQVICNGSNNTDNSNSLTIDVVVQPILSVESLGINVTLTQ